MPKPKHLEGIHKRVRKVKCRDCDVDVEIIGPRALPLCPPCRGKHDAETRRAKQERKRKRAEERRAQGAVPPVRGVDSASEKPALAVVPPVPEEPPAPAVDQSHAPVPQEQSQSRPRASFDEAIALICDAETKGDGIRHGWIGTTGSGKTTSLKMLLERSDLFTLVHDEKGRESQFGAVTVTRIEDAPDEATMVTFKGNVFEGTHVEAEYVASLGVNLCRAVRQQVRIVIDELDAAVSESGTTLNSPSLKVAFGQGRALGLSVFWTTQMPQRVPGPAFDQSSTIAIGCLAAKSLNYLEERLHLDKDMIRVIPTLEVGEFVIYENGRPWNGVVYATPAPAAEVSPMRSPDPGPPAEPVAEPQ